MTELGEYLLRAAERSWEWGKHDCCTFPGNWAAMRCGADPVARWRGRYGSEAEAERLIADAGGLLSLWEVGCLNALMPEVDQPQLGDVGVIRVLGEAGPTAVGAIYAGKRWSVLFPTGIGSLHAEHLKVWRP